MEIELSFKDYLLIFKRRWKQILLVFILSLILATIGILLRKPYYSSEALVLIERPVPTKEITGRDAARSNYVGELKETLTNKLFSEQNALRYNKKYNLFPALTEPDKISLAFYKASVLQDLTRDSSTSWDKQKITVGFKVAFKYTDPETAYKVANDLVAQLMDENAKSRTRRITETTSILTDELNRLKGELEVVEDKVAAYKQANANSLPEHQELYITTLDRLNADINTLDRDYKNAQEELRYLDVELSTVKAATQKNTKTAKVASDLDKARAELERALVLYKDTHPTIRALKRKIKNLESAPAEVEVESPIQTDVTTELAISKVQNQMQAARARLNAIASEKRSLQSQVKKTQAQIVKIPQVERKLFTLLRDYENAKQKYEDVKAKQLNAKIAENLEASNKAEHFILESPPEYPKYKEGLSNKLIFMAANLISLAIALAVAYVLEIMDDRVRGQAALNTILGAKPLVVIPYIQTNTELRKARRNIQYFIVLAVTLILLILVLSLIHFYVRPLNELISNG